MKAAKRPAWVCAKHQLVRRITDIGLRLMLAAHSFKPNPLMNLHRFTSYVIPAPIRQYSCVGAHIHPFRTPGSGPTRLVHLIAVIDPGRRISETQAGSSTSTVFISRRASCFVLLAGPR